MRNFCLRFARLPCVALSTNDFPDCKAINVVMRFVFILVIRSGQVVVEHPWHGSRPFNGLTLVDDWRQYLAFVVANPTSKGSAATGSNQRTLAIIVGTLWTLLFGKSRLIVADCKLSFGTQNGCTFLLK